MVKFFALSVFIFGAAIDRTALVLFPSYLIGGFLISSNGMGIYEWWEWAILAYWFIITIIPTVILGVFWPASWDELDEQQKVQYGILNTRELTAEQYKEWSRLLGKYSE